MALAVVAAMLPLALASASGGSRAHHAPFSATLHPNGPRETCPEHTLALPGDALAGAVTQALRETPKLVHGNLRGLRADAASARDSAHARVECGATVQAHTVTVHIRLPAYAPSASLQQHTLLVARFAKGYRVWFVLH